MITGKNSRRMTLEEKAVQKGERFALIGIVLAFIVFAFYLAQPVHAEQMFSNETNLSDMFMYPPPSYDASPLSLDIHVTQVNQTGVIMSYTDGKITGGGNISVVASPPGWDIALEVQML